MAKKTLKSFTAAQNADRFNKEAIKIEKLLVKNFRSMFSVQESGVTIAREGDNTFIFVLEYPDLMLDYQAKADLSDMISIIKQSSDLVYKVDTGHHNKPTPTDMWKNIFLPSISVTVEMK